MSCSSLLNIFTVQSTVILLPSIGASLSIPVSRQQLVTSVYSIASGCVVLMWGRLADMHGRRRVFLPGSLLFTAAAALIPFAPNEMLFYVLRALQGLGSAATAPSALGILAAVFPPGPQRSRAFVAFSAAAAVGSVLGNLAGGVIGGLLSWRWAFWIPAGFSGLVTVAAYVLTPDSRDARLPASNQEGGDTFVDWVGGFLISFCLILLLVSLSQANVVGWSVPSVICSAIASVLLGVAFIWWQRLMEQRQGCRPLVRLSMFESAQFSAALVIIGCFMASYNSFLVSASLFYQDYLGLDILETTLRFIPAGAIGFLACFAVAPALSTFRGFHNLLAGIVCGIVSPLLFALPTISAYAPYWAWGLPAMCLCFSADIVWPLIGLFVASNVPEADQSLASGLLQTANQVGRALGLAIATGVQTAVQGAGGGMGGDAAAFLRGVRAAQWTNVGFAVVALVVAVRFFKSLGRM
ncbi:unnamed protein product [Discula destructiva]